MRNREGKAKLNDGSLNKVSKKRCGLRSNHSLINRMGEHEGNGNWADRSEGKNKFRLIVKPIPLISIHQNIID